VSRYGNQLEISNSEAQAFLDCHRRWWLSYYRRLKPKYEAPIGPLSIGSRVHRALEEGYSSPGREEALWKVLAETIEADYALARELDCVEQFEKDCELALIMLQGFVQWASEEGLDAGWEVVSAERIVKAPAISVGGIDVVLKGKLDQMVRRDMDGALFMRDWKTTQTLKLVMMQFMPQLKMYLTLLALTEPDARVSGGQFVFLKKVKRTARAEPPFYLLHEEYVSPQQMSNFWDQTMGTLERMVEATLRLDAGESHHRLVPPRPTRDCSWRCPFYLCCDMFDDGSNVELYLEVNYEVTDPYAYYDDNPTKETPE
jgi:RecB family exonuclease